MLIELSIRNFAIIPTLTVSFDDGLNVLTGETGAGKSIIIDAISLLMGGRASTEFVRHGTNKAEIEGLFMLPDTHPIRMVLQEVGIENVEDTLILRRDISKQGKNICRVNGKLVTLAILREIGQALVDVHGQHEHQSLLHEENHISLLDDYGKEEITPHKNEYVKLYKQYKHVVKTIQQLTKNEQNLAQRLDLLSFQHHEITAANLQIGEDVELEKEKRKRKHAQKISQGVDASYEAIYGDGRALDSLGIVMSSLDELSELDDSLQETQQQIESIYYQLEDISHQFAKYRDGIEFDDKRLDDIESRLVQIDQLKRKYGPTVESILEYASKIEEELESIENKEERIDELINQRDSIALDLFVEAKNLTAVRKRVAQKLIAEIKEQLKGLYMDQTLIDIHFGSLQAGESIEHDGERLYVSSNGWDYIQFLISPNPGEPLKPLAKIASGGELSRLTLALKAVFANVEPVCAVIFDEVDTGVSGRVAQAMAEKLYKVSTNQQVLCISHQPQMAALADQHYRIEKNVKADVTETTIIPLQQDERIDELARMMSGSEVTEATQQLANELIMKANETKDELQEKLSI